MPARSLNAADAPEGYRYEPDAVSAAEETRLLEEIAGMPFDDVVFRGVVARRRVVHFGVRYDFERRGVDPGQPIPPAFVELRERLAPLGDRPAERYEEVLLTEYRPGATIGWHRDAPYFGSTVLGLSLGSACRMRFRRERAEGGWTRWERILEPRSAYVLAGPARATWQHSIPPTPDLRYSITFRTMRSR